MKKTRKTTMGRDPRGGGGFRPEKQTALRPEDVEMAPMIGPGPICMVCRHFHQAGPLTRDTPPGLTCDAFPAGIPYAILTNAADHRRPFDGDRGIQFGPRHHEDVRRAERTIQQARRGGPLPDDGSPA